MSSNVLLSTREVTIVSTGDTAAFADIAMSNDRGCEGAERRNERQVTSEESIKASVPLGGAEDSLSERLVSELPRTAEGVRRGGKAKPKKTPAISSHRPATTRDCNVVASAVDTLSRRLVATSSESQ